MSVSDFLLRKSRQFTTFLEPEGYGGRIIEVNEFGTTSQDDYTFESLKSQLKRFSQAKHPTTSRGSLHLLLHRLGKDKHFNPSLPFENQGSLDTMIESLQLPRLFPYDYGRWQHIPARMNILGEGLEIVCNTPKFPTAWATFALWYNFQSRTTSCFLAVTEGEMAGVLEVVDDLKSLASHPLLLPIALYWVCSQILRRDMRSVHQKMEQVQIETGLLKNYLKVDGARAATRVKKSADQAPTLTEIHEVIVVQHALLTRGLTEFTEELGRSCRSALGDLDLLSEQGKIRIDQGAHLELRNLLAHTEISTKYELHHRNRMLSRVDMQLQVLYNLMQSRIGDETLRDSSAMKGIALLTMTFLPSTALATIFSMSTFFSQTPDNTHVLVSSEFWIFWALAGPITILVLISYFIWVQWAEIRRWWRGEPKRQDVEARAGLAAGYERIEARQLMHSPSVAATQTSRRSADGMSTPGDASPGCNDTQCATGSPKANGPAKTVPVQQTQQVEVPGDTGNTCKGPEL